MSSRPAPKIGFSFEYLMWIFTRLSGVIMILLAFFGLCMAFTYGARLQLGLEDVVRWMFFPNSYHVQAAENPDAWFNTFWNIMQTVIIFFAGTHGVNGLRVVIEDYLKGPKMRILLRGLLFLFWLFMLLVALVVIWLI
jgi:succinate dehydrogenase / fumarate reductase membrane anchor subunit